QASAASGGPRFARRGSVTAALSGSSQRDGAVPRDTGRGPAAPPRPRTNVLRSNAGRQPPRPPPSGSFTEDMITRGRMPAGPELIEHLEGSDKAKERLRIILETMMGKWRVQQACLRLNICEQRFRQLRDELLQAALERLEGRPAGRPRRAAEPEETMA